MQNPYCTRNIGLNSINGFHGGSNLIFESRWCLSQTIKWLRALKFKNLICGYIRKTRRNTTENLMIRIQMSICKSLSKISLMNKPSHRRRRHAANAQSEQHFCVLGTAAYVLYLKKSLPSRCRSLRTCNLMQSTFTNCNIVFFVLFVLVHHNSWRRRAVHNQRF